MWMLSYLCSSCIATQSLSATHSVSAFLNIPPSDYPEQSCKPPSRPLSKQERNRIGVKSHVLLSKEIFQNPSQTLNFVSFKSNVKWPLCNVKRNRSTSMISSLPVDFCCRNELDLNLSQNNSVFTTWNHYGNQGPRSNNLPVRSTKNSVLTTQA